MIDIPRDRWSRIVNVVPPSATFECPKCGQLGSLLGHTIAADGTVSPSVVHSYPVDGVEACGFHDHVRLLGWPGE